MTGKSGNIQMKGSEVFKKAIEKMSTSVESILESNNLSINDIDYFVPHQANQRIISAIANKFELSKGQVIVTIEKHANCSAASIPLALSELKSTKGIERGKLIVFTAFGAGATWGSVLVRW